MLRIVGEATGIPSSMLQTGSRNIEIPNSVLQFATCNTETSASMLQAASQDTETSDAVMQFDTPMTGAGIFVLRREAATAENRVPVLRKRTIGSGEGHFGVVRASPCNIRAALQGSKPWAGA